MLTKNSEKLIRSLSQRKNRKKTGLFVAEGMKLVRDFVSAGISADIVYHVEELGEDFRDVRCVQISEAEMKRITFLETPSPILALFEQPDFGVEDFKQANFILLLDRVQDPGNMGTLLRTALWYGVDCVATTVGTVDPFSPKVVQSSMSAHAFSRIVQLEEEQWATWAGENGFSWVVADMHGEDSRNFNWPEKTILVLGNEGQGPSAFLKEQGPAITLAGDASKMESLNVAVSGATLLYAHACSIGS